MTQTTWRDYGKWIAVFLAYPVAGLVGRLIANPADGLIAAFATAAVAGAVLATAQWLALSRPGPIAPWVGATAAGLGLSFMIVQALGATSSSAAPLIGAITGVGVGIAQALAGSGRLPSPVIWVPTVGVAWTIAWVVTTSIGVQAEAGWPVVGLSGALTAQAMSGLVLMRFSKRQTQQASA